MPVSPVAPAIRTGVATIGGLDTISGTKTTTGAGPQKPAAVLAEGEVFNGRYTIERLLGAGAMGVVYAANDQVTKRRVALKLINPALADRASARERFIDEGLKTGDVRHPNVVAMHDVGDASGQLYLVMEYLSGETLRKWLHDTLEKEHEVPFETARGIIRSVLEGLAAAHAIRLVHRDLKPENVMLTGDPNKGDYRLKILDFGIARAVGAATHVTTTSASTGTPLYMAPEQKTAADTVGPSADLYAVTAMLYELLLGVAPEGRWGVPSKERPDLPPGIDVVIETGLANRPKSRYQSAADYIKALDSVGSVTVPEQGKPTKDVTRPPQPPEHKSQVPPTKESWYQWLRSHSQGWGLWFRMSKKQRYIVSVVIFVLMVIWIIVSSEPATAPIAGRWADEVTGTGVPIAFVDVSQRGTEISGAIYDSYGNHAGTFQGEVRGRTIDYQYQGISGATGTGRGQVSADGTDLLVEVRDNATGATQHHTMHKMPPQ